MAIEPTVFVVDDDPAVRESLRWLIESVGLCVSTYGSAGGFLDAYDPHTPGCLVLDVRMPGKSGLKLQEELAARGINIPIIFITGYGDIPVAVRAMKAGAVDFIEKPFDDQALLDLIQKCIERDAQMRLREERHAEALTRLAALTPRERQVMEMVVAGGTNKVIAKHLKVSSKTVEAHRGRVMDKMLASNVAELVRIAMDAGVTRENPKSYK
jgi:FixJ family two-component response regulator